VCIRLGIYFLWHWAQVLGQRPDLSVCASCAREVSREKPLWYSVRDEALYCENCGRLADSSNPTDSLSWFRLGPGARLWLKEISSLPPSSLTRISLDAQSLEQAKALTKAVLAGALGKRLNTWDLI